MCLVASSNPVLWNDLRDIGVNYRSKMLIEFGSLSIAGQTKKTLFNLIILFFLNGLLIYVAQTGFEITI